MLHTWIRYGEMRYRGIFRTEIDSVRAGDRVIVRSPRGVEVGIALTNSDKQKSSRDEIAGEIVRLVNPQDVQKVRMLDQLGKTKSFRYVKSRIENLGLPMKVSYIEQLYGGEKVLIYFRSEGRVDFRQLVRDLNGYFKTRVVMKQVGARDEARLLGDWNDCGRELCCRTHLQQLVAVPMKMAKSQKTTLDPAKISGRCGRLKCCLRYEHDTYVQLRARLPRRGQRVRTREGAATVTGADVLSQLVSVEIDDGTRVHLPAAEVLPLDRPGKESKKRRSSQASDFYVTVPFFNIETPVSVNTVYAGIAADVLKRYHSGAGRNVHFLTGVKDHHRATQGEHEEETSLHHRASLYQENLQEEWERISVSASRIFRTGEEIHKKTVADFFRKLRKNNDIYRSEFRGWHCPRCHASRPGEPDAEGSCEQCHLPLEFIEEALYFFRLSKFQKKLLTHFQKHAEFIKPNLFKMDIEHRVSQRLHDVIVARTSFDSGIPIPDEPDQIISGWFEGLLAYVSGLADGQKNPLFSQFWPVDVHLVTRDTAWIHCVVWPAMLLAGELDLPKQIVVAGHWEVAGEGPPEAAPLPARKIVEKAGGESLRYHLLQHVPFGLDGVFETEAFEKTLQRHLVETIGNLADRIASTLERTFDSTLPPTAEPAPMGESVRSVLDRLEHDYDNHMNQLQFSVVLAEIWEGFRAVSRSIDEIKPWNLERTPEDRERLTAFMHSFIESTRILAVFMHPFLPRTSKRLLQKIGLEPEFTPIGERTRRGPLPAGLQIDRSVPLFSKLQDRSARRPRKRPSRSPSRSRRKRGKPRS